MSKTVLGGRDKRKTEDMIPGQLRKTSIFNKQSVMAMMMVMVMMMRCGGGSTEHSFIAYHVPGTGQALTMRALL